MKVGVFTTTPASKRRALVRVEAKKFMLRGGKSPLKAITRFMLKCIEEKSEAASTIPASSRSFLFQFHPSHEPRKNWHRL